MVVGVGELPGGQDLDVGAQACERRTKFVGGVVNQAAFMLPGLGERREHRVQAVRERGEFRATRSITSAEFPPRSGAPPPLRPTLGFPMSRWKSSRATSRRRPASSTVAALAAAALVHVVDLVGRFLRLIGQLFVSFGLGDRAGSQCRRHLCFHVIDHGSDDFVDRYAPIGSNLGDGLTTLHRGLLVRLR